MLFSGLPCFSQASHSRGCGICILGDFHTSPSRVGLACSAAWMRSPPEGPSDRNCCVSHRASNSGNRNCHLWWLFGVYCWAASVICVTSNPEARSGNGPCTWVSKGLHFIASTLFLLVESKDRSPFWTTCSLLGSKMHLEQFLQVLWSFTTDTINKSINYAVLELGFRNETSTRKLKPGWPNVMKHSNLSCE